MFLGVKDCCWTAAAAVKLVWSLLWGAALVVLSAVGCATWLAIGVCALVLRWMAPRGVSVYFFTKVS